MPLVVDSLWTRAGSHDRQRGQCNAQHGHLLRTEQQLGCFLGMERLNLENRYFMIRSLVSLIGEHFGCRNVYWLTGTMPGVN